MDRWLLHNGEALQFVLYASLLALFGAVEFWRPHRPGPMRRGTRWPVNFGLTLVNVAVLPILPVSFLGAALWADRNGIGLFHWLALPAAAVATLAARAFISFVTHYLNHMVPWLWRIHRVHHLDTELDVSTTVRFHPLEFGVGLIVGLPVIVGLGLTPWMLVAYEVLDTVVNLWTHSNTRAPESWERVLRYVIVTPELHRIHHSAWKPETNSNFGAVFPMWDLIFGTYRSTPRHSSATMPLGLDSERGPEVQQLSYLLSLRKRVSAAMDAQPRDASVGE